MKAKLDYVFLGLLGISVIISAWLDFAYGYVLSINNYAGFSCLVIALIIRKAKPKLGRYATALLLILGSLNILNFSVIHYTISFGFGSHTDLFGVDPIIMVMLSIYYFINKQFFNPVFNKLLYGSEEESKTKQQKMVDFYYEKFKGYSTEELNNIYADLTKYPTEAQIALKQIRCNT